MGLLDEAIREHLELKRLRGGDPTQIAQAEREALDPVFPEEGAPADGVEPSAPAEFSSVGEETAELDMQEVLAADEQLGHDGPADEQLTEEHPVPPVSGEVAPEAEPGQERISFE
jgi:hypothetical protein